MIKSKSYEFVLNEIKEKLIKLQERKRIEELKTSLSEEDIRSAIKGEKDLINIIGHDHYSEIKMIGFNLEPLHNNNYERIQKELETYFNVTMDKAIFIKSLEQQKRESNWWSMKKSLENENFYWNRYKELVSKKLPSLEARLTLDDDTNRIIDNIGDPTLDGEFLRMGLVIGHVQSGKTLNYSAVINKATDAKYKLIVVITGTLNNLRNQTQERLIESYVGEDAFHNSIGVGQYSDQSINKTPTVLTQSDDDFKVGYARTLFSPNDISKPILLVIKKNVSTLKALNGWLEKHSKDSKFKDRALLVIDDESDYASINTNKEDEDPTAINKGIRKLLSNFEKASYIAYTATPYANILIDHGAKELDEVPDLFPKDFICTLKAPSNYHGAKNIFVENKSVHFRRINSNELEKVLPLNHKNTFKLKKLPDDLLEAIHLFYLNIAIRKLRNQENKHNSMLIHITRFTNVHEDIRLKVKGYIEELNKFIKSFILSDSAEKQSLEIFNLKKLYEKEYHNLEFSWEDIKKALYSSKKIIVCGEYKNSPARVDYSNKLGNNIIAIGGLSLARGFTLEGLSVSYFFRTTIFYDTLMQMGRWFGYRDSYEDICRVYTTEDIADYFAHIQECTEELVCEIQKMNNENKTPEELGLFIKRHPDNILQVTARNKQKHSKDVELMLNFSGKLKETLYIYNSEKENIRNLNLIKNFINNLNTKPETPLPQSSSRLWRDIPRDIVVNFIQEFKLPISINTTSISNLNKNEIVEYINEQEIEFDVALYSGSGDYLEDFKIYKQKRNSSKIRGSRNESEVIKVQENRKISSGESEGISLDVETRRLLGYNSTELRKKLKKAILMLHLVQPREDSDVELNTLVAFGISFPTKLKHEPKTKKIKINTVYIKKLYEAQKLEELESDD